MAAGCRTCAVARCLLALGTCASALRAETTPPEDHHETLSDHGKQFSFISLGDWGGAALNAKHAKTVHAVAQAMCAEHADCNSALLGS
eukprot:6209528-Pleurochrysis_carterae.AAC.1